MLFSSMIFLWVFLPIVLIVYYFLNLIIKNNSTCIFVKNVFLFVASIIFYAWGGIYYALIMISSIVLNFFGGMIISKMALKQKWLRGLLLFVVIALNLLILFYFKYFNMVIVAMEQIATHNPDTRDMLSKIFNMERTYSTSFKDVVLPIGISFFTFQAMSYVIDVYRNDAIPQKDILNFGLYVAFFPQLIAGPIVRYTDVAKQILYREENRDKFLKGIKRFCYGLGKKVIIANTFAVVVDSIWALELDHIGCTLAWIGIIFYALQIYYDFSGYSDMAIGLGLMFGFEFKENFNYPYAATSIVDFWRRWHMSLTTWFREYVYFPLGGSRKGVFRTCLNILIIYLLTGIWHGANYTFIFWGLAYAILQIIERLFLSKLLKINKLKILNFIYTQFFVIMLWIPFRANTLNDAVTYFMQLFVMKSSYSVLSYLSIKVIVVFVMAIFGMGLIQKIFYETYALVRDQKPILFFDVILQMLILIYSIFSVVSGTYNPFIYFQF